jgi:hypothetical protein
VDYAIVEIPRRIELLIHPTLRARLP